MQHFLFAYERGGIVFKFEFLYAGLMVEKKALHTTYALVIYMNLTSDLVQALNVDFQRLLV